MFLSRQLIAWFHVFVAFVAMVNATVGCEHCWHQISKSTVSSTISTGEAPSDSGQENGAHVCVCDGHVFIGSETFVETLAFLPSTAVKLNPSYQPVTQSPPLLPPRA